MRVPDYDHELKTWPAYFRALEQGKSFEVRRDDRGFQRGQVLWLREYDPKRVAGKYSGKAVFCEITYVLTGGQFGIEAGFVVMGLRLLGGEE